MNKNRWLFGLFLVFSLFLSACSTSPSNNQAAEDFAVYTAAFQFEFKVSSLDGLAITQLSHAAATDHQEAYLKTEFEGIASPEVMADFLSKNQAEQPLDGVFAQNPEIKLLSKDEISKIFDPVSGQNGWQEFNTRYPKAKGLITVSMIGYDRSRTHAMLVVGSQSAPLAGYGEFLLMEKVNGTWQVQKNVMAWIS